MRLLSLLILLLLPTTAQAEIWAIDGGHSQVGFAVKHMMLSNVKGRFAKFSGTVDIPDEKDITKSKLEVEIDASTITTDNDARDKDLRGPEFLNVEKSGKITFKSTRVERAGRGRLRITGDLTIRETTRPVMLEVEGPSDTVKDPWGNNRRAVVASTKINRKDFGVSWHKTMDNGGLIAGDDVTITIEAELVQQQAPKK